MWSVLRAALGGELLGSSLLIQAGASVAADAAVARAVSLLACVHRSLWSVLLLLCIGGIPML